MWSVEENLPTGRHRHLLLFIEHLPAERVFKWPFNPLARVKLGVYLVGSVANVFNNPVQFKIGLTTWDRLRNNWGNHIIYCL
jgi:hypothetical protein